MSNWRIGATWKVQELLELFTQNVLDETGSTGDVEVYKRKSETVQSAGALSALLAMLFGLQMLLAMLFALQMVKGWFEYWH